MGKAGKEARKGNSGGEKVRHVRAGELSEKEVVAHGSVLLLP